MKRITQLLVSSFLTILLVLPTVTHADIKVTIPTTGESARPPKDDRITSFKGIKGNYSLEYYQDVLLRKSASSKSKVVAKVKQKTYIPIVSASKDWFKVKMSKGYAYLHHKNATAHPIVKLRKTYNKEYSLEGTYGIDKGLEYGAVKIRLKGKIKYLYGWDNKDKTFLGHLGKGPYSTAVIETLKAGRIPLTEAQIKKGLSQVWKTRSEYNIKGVTFFCTGTGQTVVQWK
ncbi:hypothetical protein [Peribacillus glennii]|uniref:SH3 domain-containing protein n=1 Tax=Peribacillus glennii TaxID=2303991 RepID=A0A372L7P2_9BACI|nr:hypothetical protein [Peribacillus glennii]RFU60773.1 hypothetical protein D0466_20700 [Peribacillus glennii]